MACLDLERPWPRGEARGSVPAARSRASSLRPVPTRSVPGASMTGQRSGRRGRQGGRDPEISLCSFTRGERGGGAGSLAAGFVPLRGSRTWRRAPSVRPEGVAGVSSMGFTAPSAADGGAARRAAGSAVSVRLCRPRTRGRGGRPSPRGRALPPEPSPGTTIRVRHSPGAGATKGVSCHRGPGGAAQRLDGRPGRPEPGRALLGTSGLAGWARARLARPRFPHPLRPCLCRCDG